MTALTVSHVTKTHRRGAEVVEALRDVSISLEAGIFAAITGPSGSGKSTLLNVVAGFDRIDSGQIRVGDLDMSAAREADLDRLRSGHIGFVFQLFNLIPGLTALENVELALVPAGVGPGDRRLRAKEALERLGLEAEGGRRPAELSGGQQQRVALARALVGRPKLLLADEPTASLDRVNADAALADFRRLAAEEGLAILVSTHDSHCLAAADRVITLEDGKIAE
ncbi:MAG TPA: ABC transporter ATP-binding protein [Allosphingosinicella sp.]|nr:ABC transporter ATP-binding protein [Allosphingosinicella sp.]